MSREARARLLVRVRQLARLPDGERRRLLGRLTDAQRAFVNDFWDAWAHDGQLEPAGDWRLWMIRAGRGFGKTRAGAEWVSAFARGHDGARIALVGATIANAKAVMVEGPSGLIAVARDDERPRWRA